MTVSPSISSMAMSVASAETKQTKKSGNSVIVGVRIRPENEAERKAAMPVAFTASVFYSIIMHIISLALL